MNASKKSEQENIMGHYNVGATIGQGTFGKVKVATEVLTGEKVAVKILEKEKICEKDDLERVVREISILKVLRHPYIAQLFEIIETDKELYLIMEYACGGELFDYIVSRQKIGEAEACLLFQQLIAGVEYFARMNITHRDLKPENLLLDQEKRLKIVDFGLSNSYKTGQKLKTPCGSPCYAAPEMLQDLEYNGLSVDIWSCGVVLYAMLCGFLPFDDPNTSALYQKIIKGEYQKPKFLSQAATALISGILNVNPSERFGLDEIKNSPWFKSVSQSIKSGVDLNENQDFIDENVLESVEKLGLNSDAVKKSVNKKKNDYNSTVYYLLVNKKEREAKCGRLSAKKLKIQAKQEIFHKVERVESRKPKKVEQKVVVKRNSNTKSPVKIHLSGNSKPSTPSKSPRKPQSPRKSVSPVKTFAFGRGASPVKRSPLIETFQGPYNVECISSKPLSTLTQTLSSVLTNLKIRYTINGYKYICQNNSKLCIEICKLQGSSMYLFKFSGTSISNPITEEILSMLDL